MVMDAPSQSQTKKKGPFEGERKNCNVFSHWPLHPN
jgi:hypothetical protein